MGMRNYPVDRLLNRMTLMRNGRFYYITLSSSTLIINIPTQHLGGFGKQKSLSSREQIAVYLMSKPSRPINVPRNRRERDNKAHIYDLCNIT